MSKLLNWFRKLGHGGQESPPSLAPSENISLQLVVRGFSPTKLPFSIAGQTTTARFQHAQLHIECLNTGAQPIIITTAQIFDANSNDLIGELRETIWIAGNDLVRRKVRLTNLNAVEQLNAATRNGIVMVTTARGQKVHSVRFRFSDLKKEE